MSNYTKTTNFATKDNLSPGNPLKIVKGAEIDTEFNNIQTAVATKTDNSAANITGGSITGITDLAIADGGTGASTAAAALNNLLPSQTSAANKYLQSDGTNASWDAVSLSTADITGTLAVANGGTGVTTSTGTGAVVLSNSPTLVTPALGTPASGVATNLTGLPISTGVSGLGTGVATLLATPSSANLASAITDETGSGALVFANSPTLVTPVLGTPASGTLTNATGLPISTGVSGLGTGVATFLGTPSSANLLAAVSDETGTGALVFATSPTLVTPVLGTPASGVATNLTGLPLSTGVTGTLPVLNGGTGQTSYTDGQLLIGNTTGNTLTKATLTAGSNITITNSAGGITIAASAGGTGDVVGPASATANGIALFDGTTGKLLKNSSAQDGLINGLTVGRGAGAVATNVALGQSALAGNSTGLRVTAVGNQALLNNTASENTALGARAMLTNTSGANNTAVGRDSMYFNTTGAENSALGLNSLIANTTGSNNTAIGRDALQANTTASNNTAVGYQAAYSNTTAGNNTIVGRQAFYSNTTGASNTALGDGASYYNSTGSFNVSVGRDALLNNTTADNNTAVGYQAGYSNTTGTTITAVGRQALYANSTGANNVAVGNSALYANTTGTNNISVGDYANGQNTTGSYNVAIGRSALDANTTASYNTALGYQAGYSTTANGSSTFVGAQAGLSTTGTVNTFIGQGAGSSVTTGGKNTILGSYSGNQGSLDIRTSSNNIVLSDGDGNPRARWDSAGMGQTVGGGNGSYAFQIINGGNSTPYGLYMQFTGSSPNNTSQYFLECSDATTQRYRIYSNGTSGSVSDVRLKKNVETSRGYLSDLCQLRVVKYGWLTNDDSAPKELGFIAQEVEEVFPTLVDNSGKHKMIKHTVLIPMLVKAIQELKAEFDAYKLTHP